MPFQSLIHTARIAHQWRRIERHATADTPDDCGRVFWPCLFIGALLMMAAGLWAGFTVDAAWFGVGAGAMVLSIGAFVGLMSRAPAAPILAGRDTFWDGEQR